MHYWITKQWWSFKSESSNMYANTMFKCEQRVQRAMWHNKLFQFWMKQKILRDFLISNTFAYVFGCCKHVANSSSFFSYPMCVCVCVSGAALCSRYLSVEWKTVLWCALNYVLGICLHCILCNAFCYYVLPNSSVWAWEMLILACFCLIFCLASYRRY